LASQFAKSEDSRGHRDGVEFIEYKSTGLAVRNPALHHRRVQDAWKVPADPASRDWKFPDRPDNKDTLTNHECLQRAREFYAYADIEGYRGSPHEL
jgi:hypothetical protein